jgi:electron transfer flavoprotein beta subunit
MKIIVCIKQAADPEAPPDSFKVDASGRRVALAANVPLVLDPYSEHALEAALKLKDTHGSYVTALSLGTDMPREVIKKPLAMGADELILLEDEAFADGDSWSTAYALAAAIKKTGGYDLILCGRQAADWGEGQVGLGIAEVLNLPGVTIARKIDIAGDKAQVERVTGDSYEVIETPLPSVVTVSNEIGEPRYPTIRGIMASKKKEPVIWKPADIDVLPAEVGTAGRRSHLVHLFQPVHVVDCQIISGDTPEEAGINLANRLRLEKLI